VRGFENEGAYGANYGRNKDKVFDAKLQVLREGSWLPSLAVGTTDALGTQLFKGSYVVATKSFGALNNVEVSVGHGWRRPSGPFAGARWVPLSAPNWAMVAEYDANDYKSDYQAARTAAGTRSKGLALGVEYRWGWLGAQVARHRDHFSANAYVSIPFSERNFIPQRTSKRRIRLLG
jgi:hypothetical protein